MQGNDAGQVKYVISLSLCSTLALAQSTAATNTLYCGAHALGRCHPTSSGYEGPWTPTPTTFNNAYYTLLLNIKWEVDPKKPNIQYKDPSGKLMMLPSDIVLIQDPKFKEYVSLYAKEPKTFNQDFADCFSRLLELGCEDKLYSV